MATADRGDDPPVTVEEHAEPPAPDAVFAVVNPVMSLLLRSPLHRLVSESLLLLEFTGRRSGDTYRTPVGYTQLGETLYVFTHSPWWHNFEQPRDVTVWLRGDRRTGTATAHSDPAAVAERIRTVIEAEGLAVARRIGLEIDGGLPEESTLAAAIEETVAIEVDLAT